MTEVLELVENSGPTALEPADLLGTSSRLRRKEGTQMEFSAMETDCTHDRKSHGVFAVLVGTQRCGDGV